MNEIKMMLFIAMSVILIWSGSMMHMDQYVKRIGGKRACPWWGNVAFYLLLLFLILCMWVTMTGWGDDGV